MNQKILLVEDERHIAESLLFNLEDEYTVDWVETGEDALVKSQETHYDLIVLDVMLPGKSGYDVCRAIRLRDAQTPILFLTAKGDTKDRIEGLKLGADDYLGKPFDLDEFMLRAKALIKRGATAEPRAEAFRFGPNAIRFDNYEAIAGGRKIALTPKECNLMRLLIENVGQVVTREEILTKVWGYEELPSTRTIDNFIVRLRNYFEEKPREPKYILSVHGVGYRFMA